MYDLYIIYLFIFSLLILNIFNFFKIKKRFNKKEAIIYVYLLISILLWIVSNAFSDIVKETDIALFFARLSIIFPLHVLNGFLQIVKDYPPTLSQKKSKIGFKIVVVITVIFTFAMLFILNTPFNIADFIVYKNGPASFTPGIAYIFVMSLGTVELFYIFIYWFSNFSFYTKTQKKQVLLLILVLLAIYISLILGLVLLPMNGLSKFSPTMFLSLALLLFVINQGLWIKGVVVSIEKDLVNLTGLVIITGFSYFLVKITRNISDNLSFVSSFLAIMLALIFANGIYKKITKRPMRDFDKILKIKNDFSESITRILSKNIILEELKESIKFLFKKSNISFLEKNNEKFYVFENLFKWFDESKENNLITREIVIEKQYSSTNKEDFKQIYDIFVKENIDIILSLKDDSNKTYILVIIKNIQEALNSDDYEVLTSIVNNATVALSRAFLYQQVEDFNKTLQLKVNEQTKELQIKVKELEEARRKEADMIDIMGHELRTPATIVKINVDLLHKLQDKVIDSKEDFLKYVSRIKDAVDNEIKLINTLLSSAKLEGDKIEINPEKINIYEEIDMAIHGEEVNAKEKGLVILNNVSSNISPVFADHARVVEILNNLISNAVKYTQEGSVIVEGREVDSFVEISITDTGAGISKEDLDRLGTKFFRTSNYINGDDEVNIVRPGGTGLGLYVTFNLVRKMGGDIKAESELGKGSKFVFTLPKYTGQKESSIDSVDMFQRLGLKK